MWEDAQGKQLKLEIMGFNFMSSIGPIIAEQLRRQGVETTFTMPPDASRRFTAGDYFGHINGHGGSVSGDPYFTLRLFQTASSVVPGQAPTSLPRWSNKAYDKVVDDMYLTPTEDSAKLKDLFHKAMEVWLPELPNIQLTKFYHNVAMNQTYWKGWPTQENPYINGNSWHCTYPLLVNTIEPVQ
jgi:peptide/nickel transport system substrate-binding protein